MMGRYWVDGGGYAPWGNMMGNNPWFWGAHYFLGVFTWLLIMAVLVALLRWLWKKGNK